MVGSPVCAAHGAKAPRARELAEQSELIAEIMHANPDLTLREIFVRAAGVATAAAEDCDSADPGERVNAWARAASLAKTAADVGIGIDDRPESLISRQGSEIAAVLRSVLSELVPRFATGPRDAELLREWLSQAVVAALRGGQVPKPPALWRLSYAPALPGRMVRRREREAREVMLAEATDAALAEAERAVSAPSRPVTSSPLSMDVVRDDVTPSLADLRAGRHPENPWRRGSPWTERVG